MSDEHKQDPGVSGPPTASPATEGTHVSAPKTAKQRIKLLATLRGEVEPESTFII
ncbi:MAG: hypothetical protein O3C43_10055 [Verrucomicrobia bacterium]|nr:hypothetical protein [Verrucomicrobiota bacterium]MDA1066835.1 hypothetical protein [Verrucomicrobiota bacterium]